MTRNQMESIKKVLPHQTATYRFFNTNFNYVIEMVNSSICYSKYMKERDNIDPASLGRLIYEESEYLQELGQKHMRDTSYMRNSIIDIIEEQLNDIDHIEYGIFEDSEGQVYNHIVFVDEVK